MSVIEGYVYSPLHMNNQQYIFNVYSFEIRAKSHTCKYCGDRINFRTYYIYDLIFCCSINCALEHIKSILKIDSLQFSREKPKSDKPLCSVCQKEATKVSADFKVLLCDECLTKFAESRKNDNSITINDFIKNTYTREGKMENPYKKPARKKNTSHEEKGKECGKEECGKEECGKEECVKEEIVESALDDADVTLLYEWFESIQDGKFTQRYCERYLNKDTAV